MARTLATVKTLARYPAIPVTADSLDIAFEPPDSVAASLAKDFTALHADLVFTAKAGGVLGNSITIEFVDPAQEEAAEVVDVVGSAITVTLRSVSTVLSTAAQVKTAIEGEAAADALISVAFAAGQNGSGLVEDFGPTNLAAGTEDTGFEIPATGREVALVRNSTVGTETFTVESVRDKFGREGDIAAYSLGAGEIAVLVPPLEGFQQTDGKIYLDVSDIGMLVSVLRVPSMA